MQQENFSPQESLNLISETINKVKQSYHDSGVGPILWGCVITVCGIVSFFAGFYKKPELYYVWFLVIIAIVPQIFISIRENKQKKFTSFNDVASNAIWTTFGFSMMMITAIEAILESRVHAAVYMLLYGIPTILTGLICKLRPMLWGGILCWVFAICSLFTKYPYPFLFTAASAVAAWLIPGLMMNNNYRKLKAANV